MLRGGKAQQTACMLCVLQACNGGAFIVKPLLQLQSDPKYRAGLQLRKPQARLRHFVGCCASKRYDDAGGGYKL